MIMAPSLPSSPACAGRALAADTWTTFLAGGNFGLDKLIKWLPRKSSWFQSDGLFELGSRDTFPHQSLVTHVRLELLYNG